MQALRELFGTDVGLPSLGGLLFMIGMGLFFLRYFVRHATEDAPPQLGPGGRDADARSDAWPG